VIYEAISPSKSVGCASAALSPQLTRAAESATSNVRVHCSNRGLQGNLCMPSK
jgi:hypothetical protein